MNRKPMHDILFDGNGNIFSICRHFKDIHRWNVSDFDFGL